MISVLRTAFAGLAVLAMISGSCGGDEVDVEIDQAFTTAQSNEIRRAAEAWNERARSKIVFVEDGEWLVLPANVPNGKLGYSQGQRKLMRVSPATPEDQVYAVALHELGHALGLKHTKTGVMNPDKQTTEFSGEDMAECARVGACETP